MTIKVLATAAALTLFGATAASACSWDKSYTAQTTVDLEKTQMEMQVAQVPVDAWLIKYLDDWQKA